MGVDYTKYEHRNLVNLLPNTDKACFLLKQLFEPNYCEELLEHANKIGFKNAREKYPASYRNNERLQIDNSELAAELYSHCEKYLPKQQLIKSCQMSLVGLNSRFRYCKYSAGQKFSIHQDGVFHQSKRRRSALTFLLYLNDSDEYHGGETFFYSDQYGHNLLAEHRPKVGDVLVFEHDIWHSGNKVDNGNKFILRSDFIYEQDMNDTRIDDNSANLDKHHQGYIWKITNLSNHLFATASRDKSIKIWDKKLKLQQNITCHDNSVLDLSVNTGGDIFAVSRDGYMSKWSKVNNRYRLVFRVDTKHPCALTVRVLSNGNIITTGSDAILRIWKDSGIEIASSQKANDWHWQTLEFTDDHLVSCCADGLIYLWNLHDLSLKKSIDLDLGSIRCMSRDKSHLFVGFENGFIASLSLSDLKLIKKWKVHNGVVRDLLPLTGVLFSCGEDNSVCSSDYFGEEQKVLYRHDSFVTSLTYLEKVIYSVSYDGCIISHKI